MEIKTSEEIFDKFVQLGKVAVDTGLDKDYKLKNTREVAGKKRWVAYDNYVSFLDRIKAPFPDFACECRDHSGTCAMCAVKKIVEEELCQKSTEKRHGGKNNGSRLL